MPDQKTPDPDDVARDGAALFRRIKTTLGDTYDQVTDWKLEVSADGTVTWHVRARDLEHDGNVSFSSTRTATSSCA